MELTVPGQWYYDEDTQDLILRSNAFDTSDPMAWKHKGEILMRLPGASLTPPTEES